VNNKELRRPEAVAVVLPDSNKKSILSDYFALTKPEITFLVTLSALAGFILASRGDIDVWTLFWTLLGIPLVSAGGATLNHLSEIEFDATMKRTASRPLPAGRILPGQARYFGYGLIVLGLCILCPLANALTGVLAALSVILYLYVYTPLKRITPYNTLVGTIPGALPALGGWTAATGAFGLGGWAIFAVLVFWQMPHFMALAWMYRKDYERADYRMWTIGDESGKLTSGIMIGFTVLMIIASLVPAALLLTGFVYLGGAILLAVWFVVPVVQFSKTKSVQDAKKVLLATVYYIPLLLVLIIIDRIPGF
jgi:protoheme IX farnesyltransferase